jgi:hypothetical protein
MYTTRWGGSVVLQYVSNGLPIICSFISVICLFKAYQEFKQFDYAKIVWLFILVGIFMFFTAESIYAVLEIGYKLDMNTVFPTFADYIWCGGYLFIFIGLILMFIGYTKSGFPMGNKKQYTILAIIIFIIISSVISFLLIPIIDDEKTTLAAKIFYLFYPIADSLVIIPAIILMYITSLFGRQSISRPWRFLAISFMFIAVADLLYSFLSWQGIYGNGNLIDLGWNCGYLSAGLAGLYQKEMVQSLNETKL